MSDITPLAEAIIEFIENAEYLDDQDPSKPIEQQKLDDFVKIAEKLYSLGVENDFLQDDVDEQLANLKKKHAAPSTERDQSCQHLGQTVQTIGRYAMGLAGCAATIYFKEFHKNLARKHSDALNNYCGDRIERFIQRFSQSSSENQPAAVNQQVNNTYADPL